MWGVTGGMAVGLMQVGYALLAAAYGGYVALLLGRGGLGRPVQALALVHPSAAIATTAWGLLALVGLHGGLPWVWQSAVMLDEIRYAAWIVFMLLLTTPTDSATVSAWRRGLRFVLPVALVVVGIGAGLIAAAAASPAGPAIRVLLACQLAWAVLGLVLVEQLFRNQSDSSRWAAKPLCLGLGAMFGYDVYLFSQALMFGAFDVDALGARPFVHAAAVPLLATALRRQSKEPGRLRVSKSAAFYSASLVLVGAYLLLVAAAGYYVRYFGGSWGGALQVALLTVALLLLSALLLSGAQRARLRVFLGKHFFRYRYDYRVEWLRFTAMLSSRATPQEVGGLVVRGLADMAESPAGALWFKVSADEGYTQAAAWNLARSTQAEPLDSVLCRFMREREWIVDLRSVRTGRSGRDEAQSVPPWLGQLPSAWLVIPLLAGPEMLGFVVLAEPRAPMELNWEVRDLLKTAARQAAAFLAQIHAAEALVEARKFEAFNRMSAFVVHDLKNIVTQLSLMLKNAERHRDNPEFQQDMLVTVGSSLERMKQLMVQLREGGRPSGATLGVELAPIVQRLQAGAAQRGRSLDIDIRDRVATRGQEQRLERVIGHVVQNALDATSESGNVWLRLSQDAGQALLVVGDSGVGMSDEFVRTQLYRPFVTTKASGMGIGSYESLQYLRELGGNIAVDSEVGRGTLVTLSMPLFHSQDDSVMREPHPE